MTEIDAVAGMYNIVNKNRHETADYQIPVEEFTSKLRNHDLPDEICVVYPVARSKLIRQTAQSGLNLAQQR